MAQLLHCMPRNGSHNLLLFCFLTQRSYDSRFVTNLKHFDELGAAAVSQPKCEWMQPDRTDSGGPAAGRDRAAPAETFFWCRCVHYLGGWLGGFWVGLREERGDQAHALDQRVETRGHGEP